MEEEDEDWRLSRVRGGGVRDRRRGRQAAVDVGMQFIKQGRGGRGVRVNVSVSGSGSGSSPCRRRESWVRGVEL